MSQLMTIVNTLREKGVRLGLDASCSNLSIKGNVSHLTDEDKQALRTEKEGLIEMLLSQRYANVEIPKTEILQDTPILLSPNQKSIWVQCKMAEDNRLYTVPALFKFEFVEFSIDVFRDATSILAKEHKVMSYCFAELDGVPVQRSVEINVEDHLDLYQFSGASSSEKNTWLERKVNEITSKGLEIEDRPPWSISVFDCGGGEYQFFLFAHHLIIDGTSLGLMIQELFKIYHCCETGEDYRNTHIQFHDYLNWLNTNDFNSSSAFWKNQLKGFSEDSEMFVTDKIVQNHTGASELELTWDSSFVQRMETFCSKEKLAKTHFIMFAFCLTISKFSRSEDVLIGTPSESRTHPQLSGIIGDLVNVLPIRWTPDFSKTVIREIRDFSIEFVKALDHQMYPLERILEDISFRKVQDKTTLFDILISFPMNQNLGEKSGDEIVIEHKSALYDLTCSVMEYSNQTSCIFEFNTARYSEVFIRRFNSMFVALISELVTKSSVALSEISIGRNTGLKSESGSTTVYSGTVIEAIERKVEQCSNLTAVLGDRGYSYHELWKRSNHIVGKLLELGVSKSNCVLVQLEPTIDLVATILSLWRLGAVYIPVAIDLPESRRNEILEDSGANHIVTSTFFSHDLSTYGDEVQLDAVYPTDSAYIIYTSGSTGKPKGVEIPHVALLNKLQEEENLLRSLDKINTFTLTSPAFDVSFLELILPLTMGGKVVSSVSKEWNATLESMISGEVTILQGTPTYFNYFLREITQNQIERLNKSLELVCIGGESLTESLVARMKSKFPGVRINNHYGPTEITIDAIVKENISDFTTNVIGTPIGNTSAFILDNFQNELPAGVVGELYIGGPSLAKGYHNDAELTDAKFVQRKNGNQRLYATGDLCYWSEEKEIVFIGRNDKQVKYRGYRIELEDINTRLLEDSGVQNAYTQVVGKSLISWVISDKMPVELRDILIGKLPEYMVPGKIVLVDEFPITQNGKIDEKLLLSSEVHETVFVEASTAIEKAVIRVWEEVLDKSPISMEDNFLELGGNSLLLIKLQVIYKKGFSVELPLKKLFSSLNPSQHVELIEIGQKTEFCEIPLVSLAESYPMSEGQKRLWILSQFKEVSVAYNMGYGIELSGNHDVESVKGAIEKTIVRHEILRTVFKRNEEGEVRQWILPEVTFNETFEFADFSSLHIDNRRINKFVANKMRLEFDLANGPLFKVYLLKLAEGRYYFFAVIHHIISDGWSLEVLLNDIIDFYKSSVNGTEEKLPLRVQYKDFVAWQNAYMSSEKFRKDREYWLNRLPGNLPVVTLPSSKSRPIQKTNSGNQFGKFLSDQTRTIIQQFVKNNGGSLFTSYLAGLKVLLSAYAEQNELIVGIPVAGREHQELSNQIGFYLNTLPIYSTLNSSDSFLDFYEDFKEKVLEAYEHQGYPFNRLVEDLKLRRNTSRGEVFDIMVTHLAKEKVGLARLEDNVSESGIIEMGKSSTKFDLEFVFQDQEDCTLLIVNYNPDVYDQELVEHLIRSYDSTIQELFLRSEEKMTNVTSQINKEEIQHFRIEEIIQSPLVSKTDKEASRDDLDQQLMIVWGEVLNEDIDSIQADFFELGGNSVKMLRLIAQYQKEFHAKVDFKQVFNRTTLKEHAAIISNARFEESFVIPLAEPAESYPLSHGQRRLWLLSQFDSASIAYNMSAQINLNGDYHVELLLKSLNSVVSRHEILRTLFKQDGSGEIRQYIQPVKDQYSGIIFQDLRRHDEQKAQLTSCLAELSNTLFDLEKGPLYGVNLFQLEDDSYLLHYTLHHIICDGWSLNVLYKDVVSHYQNLLSGNEKLPEALPFQYKDVVVWRNQFARDKQFNDHEGYWSYQLSGELPLIDLPSTLSRPSKLTSAGYQLGKYLKSDQVTRLKQVSKEHGGSLFNNLLMLLKVLFYRYSHQNDLIIGVPVAGRDDADLNDQIGFYVNTIAIRTQIDHKDTSLSEYAEVVKNSLLEAYEHHSYPFDQLIEKLMLEKTQGRSWVFDIMVSYLEDNDLLNTTVPKDFFDQIIDYGATLSKFDMEVVFQEIGNTICLVMNFNSDVYEKHMVEQLITHFDRLVDQYLNAPNQAIGRVQIMTDEERSELLNEDHDTTKTMPTRTVLHEFNRVVSNCSKNHAVEYESESLTYEELDQYSNQFANHLQLVAHSNKRVGVLLERSKWLPVTLLGIMKSGASYVPISTNYPKERIDFIKEDSELSVVVDTAFLENFIIEREKYSKEAVNLEISVNSEAYVIYTSGSTGFPKGVSISHFNLMYFLSSYDLKKSRSSLTCSYVFDVSVMEIYSALTSGSTLVIPEESITFSPKEYAEFLWQQKISHCYLHPMHVKEISNYLKEKEGIFLERILVGVEGIKPDAVRWYVENGLKVVNGYGPTENTICTTFFTVDSLDDIVTKNIPIGKPLDYIKVYILDENNDLVPKGVIGELCIAGAGLSKGYVNRVELTDKLFVENPFSSGKMYKTGDLARYLPDGNIEFIGRKDNQVKINGHRVELGEIEHALLKHESITEVVVLAKELTDGGRKELMAYYISADSPSVIDLREHISSTLPRYMVPSYFVPLQEFPLTRNGKLDRKALPNPLHVDGVESDKVKTLETETEIKMADVWKGVLNREDIGREDHFFAQGGDSLKIIRLMQAITSEFGVQFSFAELFDHPILSEQAKLVEMSEDRSSLRISAVENAPDYMASRSQKRIWLASLKRDGSIAHNMPVTILINGKLDYDRLELAFTKLIQRHEILRTALRMNEMNDLRQIPSAPNEVDFKIEKRDLRGYDYELHGDEIRNLIDENSQSYFDIEKGEVLKVLGLQMEEEKYLINVVMHHVAGDEWSYQIFFNELMTYYRELETDKDFELAPLEIQYKDITNWQEQNIVLSEGITNYWKTEFDRPLRELDLPIDFQLESYNQDGARARLDISDKLNEQLLGLKKTHESTNSMIFSALLSTLFHKVSGSKDFVLALITAKRNAPELENQIGPYLNILPIRFDIDPSDTLDAHMEKSKRKLLEVMKNGECPFEEITKYIHPRKSGRIQVGLNVLNNVEVKAQSLSSKEMEINYFDNGFRSSKFPLCFYIYETEEKFQIQLEYQTQMFSAKTVGKILDHLVVITNQFSETKDQLISTIKLDNATSLPKIGRVKRNSLKRV